MAEYAGVVNNVPLWRRWWFPLAAGLLMAAAIAYHQIAATSYWTYFQPSERAVQHTWELGWPFPFAVRTATGEVGPIRRSALAANVLVAAALVLGTAFAAGRWRDSRVSLPEFYWPARLGQTLLIVGLTALGWAALVAMLRVPLVVFLGWLALGVVYLGVPCTAYSLVAAFRPPLRFSLATLLVIVTIVCMVLAALNARN